MESHWVHLLKYCTSVKSWGVCTCVFIFNSTRGKYCGYCDSRHATSNVSREKKKLKLSHLFTQSHTKTKCSSVVMQMAATASGMLSSSWLCWHLSAGLSISHSDSDSLIWNLDEVQESCWSSIFTQRLIWKTKVADLIRPARTFVTLITLYTNCTDAVTASKNVHDVIWYSKQMHAGDSCCWASGGDRLTNHKVLRVHSSANTAQPSKCAFRNSFRLCIDECWLVDRTN